MGKWLGQKASKHLSLLEIFKKLILGSNDMSYYRRQRGCEGYAFTGVCLSTGGGSGRGGCLVPGGSGPRGGASSQGGLVRGRGVSGPRGAPGGDPPPRRPPLRTVRILLECILVIKTDYAIQRLATTLAVIMLPFHSIQVLIWINRLWVQPHLQ